MPEPGSCLFLPGLPWVPWGLRTEPGPPEGPQEGQACSRGRAHWEAPQLRQRVQLGEVVAWTSARQWDDWEASLQQFKKKKPTQNKWWADRKHVEGRLSGTLFLAVTVQVGSCSAPTALDAFQTQTNPLQPPWGAHLGPTLAWIVPVTGARCLSRRPAPWSEHSSVLNQNVPTSQFHPLVLILWGSTEQISSLSKSDKDGFLHIKIVHNSLWTWCSLCNRICVGHLGGYPYFLFTTNTAWSFFCVGIFLYFGLFS